MPAMLLRGGKVTELPGGNMVLGVNPDEDYAQSFVELSAGDVLLLYTDGLTEAMNFENEMFGKERIIEALEKGGNSAREIAENVRWAMQRFVGLRTQSDDISMIVARVL